MKAIILAAGIGSRLAPITDTLPKCMVEVNGNKIIDRQIHNLIVNGITDIAVVTGYQASTLKSYLNVNYPFVKSIENSRYRDTNNMYSLFLAKEFLHNSDFILMNADVYFDSNIVKGILDSAEPNIIACDPRQYLIESMKVTMNSSITHISKKITAEEFYAVSIDIYKVSAKTSTKLYSVIENIICIEKNENSWTEVALDKIFETEKFMPYNIDDGRWCEIDNHEDLDLANSLFKGDSLCN